MPSLSELVVKNLPLPAKGQVCVWDESLPGFGVRVSQGGAKTFVLLDPRSKSRTRETLGRYPIVSLSEARSEAKRRMAEQTLGKHKPRSVSWDKAVEGFLAEKARKRKESTVAEYRRLLEKHFRFGAKKVGDLGPNDFHTKLEKVEALSEQRHAYVALRAFLNWAEGKHYVVDNPIKKIAVEAPSKPRSRVLSDVELGKIWRACGDDRFGRIVKLLVLTGQRKGEISELSPNMLGADCVVLPEELTKNSREHRFPLGALARELVGPAEHFTSFSGEKRKLDERSGVTGWRLHDLRRTFATGVARLGTPIHVIEKLLNHISGTFAGIVGVYQHHDFWDEQVAAIGKWEAHVAALEKEQRQQAQR